jgi:hypothetical protein
MTISQHRSPPWIEVRGLNDAEAGSQLGAAVLDAIGDQPGVLSAQLNYPNQWPKNRIAPRHIEAPSNGFSRQKASRWIFRSSGAFAYRTGAIGLFMVPLPRWLPSKSLTGQSL